MGGEGLLHFQNRGAEAVSRGQGLGDAAGLSLRFLAFTLLLRLLFFFFPLAFSGLLFIERKAVAAPWQVGCAGKRPKQHPRTLPATPGSQGGGGGGQGGGVKCAQLCVRGEGSF